MTYQHEHPDRDVHDFVFSEGVDIAVELSPMHPRLSLICAECRDYIEITVAEVVEMTSDLLRVTGNARVADELSMIAARRGIIEPQ